MKQFACFLVCLILLTGCLQPFDAAAQQPSDRAFIESTLNLANNPHQEWTYTSGADAWTLSVVSGVETSKSESSAVINGTASEPTGTDLSAWVDASDLSAVDFTLADILAYRNSGATKAVPSFDVIDHGQENYVFGCADADARHWNVFLSDIFQNEAYASVLRKLFNAATP